MQEFSIHKIRNAFIHIQLPALSLSSPTNLGVSLSILSWVIFFWWRGGVGLVPLVCLPLAYRDSLFTEYMAAVWSRVHACYLPIQVLKTSLQWKVSKMPEISTYKSLSVKQSVWKVIFQISIPVAKVFLFGKQKKNGIFMNAKMFN